MDETLIVTSERVDDIPVLVAHMARMGVRRLVDEQFPVHGQLTRCDTYWANRGRTCSAGVMQGEPHKARESDAEP
jgi:hypothetical protein